MGTALTILVDTHVLHWWLDDPARLSAVASRVFQDPATSVVISCIVPWELAIKVRAGKLNVQSVLDRWQEMLEVQGFSELPIESAHAIRAGLLPLHHRDPFDRMLAAQAQVTGWPIISADRVFDYYGVRRIW
ncbi:MAG: type II toxin-antitoxin system VapC family toxin [Candidatus Korobacteraceae bacterium]